MKRALYYTFYILESLLFILAMYYFFSGHRTTEATLNIAAGLWVKVSRLLEMKRWGDGNEINK